MYILHVKPWESSKWIAPLPEQLFATERLVRGQVNGNGPDLEQNEDARNMETSPASTADHIE
jgi:hypothetical protein